MVDFKTGEITFPSRKGFGPQTEDQTVSFSSTVKSFTVALRGFKVQFDGDDHNFHLAIVDVKGKRVDDNTIEVTGTLGLRDHSGNYDDPYSGSISYTVIAET